MLSNREIIETTIESVQKRTDLPQETKNEIIDHLKNIFSRNWFIKWDKDSIKQALYEYKQIHGYAPTVTNLSEPGMPKNITIRAHFGVNASTFLKSLFPELEYHKPKRKMYPYDTREEWLNCFKTQVEKHVDDGICCNTYNAMRDPGTPMLKTIANHCGARGWKDLLEMADIRHFQKKYPSQQMYIRSATSPIVEKIVEENRIRKELIDEYIRLIER